MGRSKRRICLGIAASFVVAVLILPTMGEITAAGETRYRDLSVFSSVLRLISDHYVEPVGQPELLRNAVLGMLKSLDPHSSYLDPSAHREMQISTRGEFYGLGIEIMKKREGYIEIVAAIDGTPAARAGLRPRDHISQICPSETHLESEDLCRTTLGMDLHEAVSLMRGPKDSKVKIYIVREGFEEALPFIIKREVVKIASVDSRILEEDFAYLRIRSFQERTADDLQTALLGLSVDRKLGISGLILDLRDNPGGLLAQAVRVADMWLDEGLIVYTEGRMDSTLQEFRARDQDEGQARYPMVVLINEGSASAAEIVAGALQDHRRALVVGAQSFGKGSVQTVYPLEDGSGLRLTTAFYYTPAGRSIQEVGIKPDIAVSSESPGEQDWHGSPVIRERDLKGSLAQPGGEGRRSGETISDFQLTRAVEVLKSWTYFDLFHRGNSLEKKRTSALKPQ